MAMHGKSTLPGITRTGSPDTTSNDNNDQQAHDGGAYEEAAEASLRPGRKCPGCGRTPTESSRWCRRCQPGYVPPWLRRGG
jgi:hypothetical protein